MDLAKYSGDPDRLVHGLSFTAYVDLETGDRAEAADLSDAALTVRGAHPLIGAYEHFQRARIHAANGEHREAQHRLVLADRAADCADGCEPPDAGYWYTPGFFGLQRVRVPRTLGYTDRAQDEVRAAVDALPDQHRRAEWAGKWRQTARPTYPRNRQGVTGYRVAAIYGHPRNTWSRGNHVL